MALLISERHNSDSRTGCCVHSEAYQSSPHPLELRALSLGRWRKKASFLEINHVASSLFWEVEAPAQECRFCQTAPLRSGARPQQMTLRSHEARQLTEHDLQD